MPSTQQVDVTQRVVVHLDTTKFTDAFMEEFRRDFYPFETVEHHVEHLAQLWARGLISEFGDPFIEGYGHASEFGLKFSTELICMNAFEGSLAQATGHA